MVFGILDTISLQIMEGKSSSGANLLPGASYGFLDLQGSTPVHHHQQNLHAYPSSMAAPRVQDVFSLRAENMTGNMGESDQTVSFIDYNKGEGKKVSLSDEEEMNCAEEGTDGKGRKGLSWQRVKWTDRMVMLLITAVSYLGDDTGSDFTGGGRRKTCFLQKKGKWKTVSKVMAERGFYVSPQQCEDKFNDLNKRYKRLNDVLGRGTSCEVVEHPHLLDMMDITEKAKEDVRKILSSKHLFYEQMCSYHNGNRLHLPHDPELHRSLQLALRSKEDYELLDSRLQRGTDLDEENQDVEADDQDDMDDSFMFGFPGSTMKRARPGEEYEEVDYGNSFSFLDSEKRSDACLLTDCCVNDNNISEGNKSDWLTSRALELEEKKLLIQEQMLELEQERLKWQRFSRKQEMELDRMKLENEHIKLDNERMGLELMRKKFNAANQ